MLENLQLNFNPASLMLLNVVLGLVMYGVALTLTVDDFKRILKSPKPVIIGLSSQLLLLPALTWAMTMVLDPAPGLALGMILVAACPGGNMSNFFTHYSQGSAELSVTMTSIVTLGAVVVTPFNFAFWAGLNPATEPLLQEVSLSFWNMARVVGLVLALPIALGMLTRARRPQVAEKLEQPFKVGSLVVFAAFVAIAFGKNFNQFVNYIDQVFALVLVHNALALGTGYLVGSVTRLSEPDRRAITIEVGIQNSGLGLVLIFNFFSGMGAMALVAAWWGVWHLIAGLGLGTYWARRVPESGAEAGVTG